MNWLKRIFTKKVIEKNKSSFNSSLVEVIEAPKYYNKAIEFYNSNNIDEALVNFDKAISLHFELHFPEEASNLYTLHGLCLQELKYHYDAISSLDKAITINNEDCNIYFIRSNSKIAILDYEGGIIDLENAIKLSKSAISVNNQYNESAKMQGYKNGAADIYERQLMIINLAYSSEKSQLERINNTVDLETKEKLLSNYHERQKMKLALIKKRN